MKITITLTILFACFLWGNAQSTDNCCEKPYIQVEGVAEMEIVPDEIYISINLNEGDEKQKVDIQELENKLKSAINSLGIDLKNLKVIDASSNFDYSLWKKEVNKRKTYELLVHDAETLGKVFKKLDELGISNARVTNYTHSKIEEYRKEVKIMAVKAAKDKASYMLETIGEKVGKPIYIIEQANNNYYGMYNSNISNAYFEVQDSISLPDLGFKTINVKYSVSAKFEIL